MIQNRKEPIHMLTRRLLLWVVLLASCTAHAANKNIPSWALSPPQDDAQSLYGVGEQKSRDQATKAALAEIAAKLGTAVRSSVMMKTTLSNNKDEKSFNETIDASVKNTEFSNFEVVETAADGDYYWVLVKVDRQAQAASLNSKTAQLKKELETAFRDFGAASSLQQSQQSPALQQKLDQLKLDAATLSALQPGYNSASIMDYALTREKQLYHARDEMVVRIEHDSNTAKFARMVEDMLTQRDMKVVNDGGRKGKSVIVIKSDVKNINIQNAYVAKVELKVDALDENGKTLRSYIKTLNGASPTSYQSALEQANGKLFEAFQKEKGLDRLVSN